ncbi:YraN family protein [Candidatus Bipolaricaulota bacterium]|jgi:putative endonuclease|nr:YraN family protein [Candidatus Bipolaricaulota bacterium]
MSMRGDESEEKACYFLKQKGYRILARNWRTRAGELDIIARDGGILVFVEVKARSGDGFGGPEAAVDRAKQRRLISAALAFMEVTKCELPTRFDVVAIRPGKMRLYQDAFQVTD